MSCHHICCLFVQSKSLTTCMYTQIHKQMFNAISSWNNSKHTIDVLGKIIKLAFRKRKHFTSRKCKMSTCLFHYTFWLLVNVISEIKSSVLLYHCLSLQLRDKSSVFRYIWNTHISRQILLSQRTVVKLLLTGTGAGVDTVALVFCDLPCTRSERKYLFTMGVNLDIAQATWAQNCSHTHVLEHRSQTATPKKMQPF